jgi:DNA polymerase
VFLRDFLIWHLSQWKEVRLMPANTLQGAAQFIPNDRTLPVLQDATQAVFGELETGVKAKKPKVAIMMIGKQPGDQEISRAGHSLVQPESFWIGV